MESINLNVRVDAEDKKNFERFCSNVGMNISTAINMFIKTVLREKKLPFEIRSEEENQYIYEKLKEAEEEMERNTKSYSPEEILESIKNILKQ